MHLVDISWRAEKDTIRPSLIGWKASSLVRQPLSLGDRISWMIEGPQKCIGFRDENGKRQPCPESTLVYQSKTSCGPCTAIDYSDACMRCDGSECLATEARLDQCRKDQYAVYIVLLGNRLKVGVSNLKRVRTRWVEQGADYGAVILQITGGDQARLVENRIGRMENIAKSVRTSQKISSLQDVTTVQDALTQIREIAKGVVEPKDIDGISVESLSSHYGFSALDKIPENFTKIKQLDGLPVVGDILGIKGPILVLKNGSSLMAIDVKRLRGYHIVEDQNASIITQSGLDEFL